MNLENIKNLQSYCFTECNSLEKVILPPIETIVYGIFSGCVNLKSVVIKNETKHIYARVFENCGIERIFLPSDLTQISSQLFKDCAKLEEIIIPNKVRSIQGFAFHNCISLKKIVVYAHMGEGISEFAFMKCTNLSEIVFMRSVSSIADNAFHDCISLTKITYCGSSPLDGESLVDFENNVSIFVGKYYLEASSYFGGLTNLYTTDSCKILPDNTPTPSNGKKTLVISPLVLGLSIGFGALVLIIIVVVIMYFAMQKKEAYKETLTESLLSQTI